MPATRSSAAASAASPDPAEAEEGDEDLELDDEIDRAAANIDRSATAQRTIDEWALGEIHQERRASGESPSCTIDLFSATSVA